MTSTIDELDSETITDQVTEPDGTTTTIDTVVTTHELVDGLTTTYVSEWFDFDLQQPHNPVAPNDAATYALIGGAGGNWLIDDDATLIISAVNSEGNSTLSSHSLLQEEGSWGATTDSDGGTESATYNYGESGIIPSSLLDTEFMLTLIDTTEPDVDVSFEYEVNTHDWGESEYSGSDNSTVDRLSGGNIVGHGTSLWTSDGTGDYWAHEYTRAIVDDHTEPGRISVAGHDRQPLHAHLRRIGPARSVPHHRCPDAEQL